MFDKYVQSPNYPQEINVTHKHAPTDESVKLLKEFEEKAELKLIKSFQCKFNELYASVFIFREYLNTIINIKFNLNGKEYIHKITVNDIDLIATRNPLSEQAKITKEEFAKFIANSILDNCNVIDVL